MAFKLIYKNLRSMITDTPLTFLVLLVIQIASAVTVVLTYGIVRNIFTEQERSDYISHRLSVEYRPDQSYSEDDLHSMGFWEDTADFRMKLDELLQERLKGIVSDGWISGIIEADGKPYTVTIRFSFDKSVFEGQTLIEGVGGEEKYTYGQYLNGEHLVKVKYHDYPVNEGDVITLGGENYTVVYTDKDLPETAVGLATTFYFPYTAMPESVRCHAFNLIFKDIPTAEQLELIKSSVHELFGYDYDFSYPKIPDLLVRQFNSMSLTVCGVVMVMVILNCVMLYMYVLKKRRNRIMVMKLCGCSEQRCAGIFILETMLVTAASFFAGVMICRGAVIPKLEPYYPAFRMVFDSRTYFILLAVMLLFVFVILWTNINLLVRKTVVNMKGGI